VWIYLWEINKNTINEQKNGKKIICMTRFDNSVERFDSFTSFSLMPTGWYFFEKYDYAISLRQVIDIFLDPSFPQVVSKALVILSRKIIAHKNILENGSNERKNQLTSAKRNCKGRGTKKFRGAL